MTRKTAYADREPVPVMPDPESITRSSMLVDFRNNKLNAEYRKFELSDLRRGRTEDPGAGKKIVRLCLSTLASYMGSSTRGAEYILGCTGCPPDSYPLLEYPVLGSG